MSYRVLARKWRPASFREMVGQQHVLRALINALDNDRLHHAYLFTGTRGVGKTTVARILARCLNCEEGVSSNPCGKCGSCLEIAEGRSVDLIEVDAASRTKVEDTRDLLDNVQYAPSHARFKIYLIDEVHMLSNHSFNALLKTLEEPPPHAKFLLATTDPQKLPATILSRCLQFNLKNMVPEQVDAHLRHILSEEGVTFDDGSLGLLARAAEGSMRDALSLTDQALAFGDGSLSEPDVRDMLGTVDRHRVLDLVTAVAGGDSAAVLAGVEAIASHAPDYAAVLEELASILHQMTVAQMVPGAIEARWGDQSRLVDLASQLSLDDTQVCYQFAINGRRDLGITPDPRVALEMTLLRMIAFRPAPSTATPGVPVLDREAEVVEATTKKPEPPALPVAAERLEAEPEPSGPESGHGGFDDTAAGGESPVPPAPSSGLPTREEWPAFFDQLPLAGITQNVALHCELDRVEGRTLFFVLDAANATLFQERQVGALARAFNEVMDPPVEVVIEVGQVGALTPQARQERLAAERQALAESSLAADEALAGFLAEFDAEVVAGSVRPPK